MFRIGHLEYSVSRRILRYLIGVFVFHIQLYGIAAPRTVTVKAIKRQKTFSSFSKIPLVKCKSSITSDFRMLLTHTLGGQHIQESIEKLKYFSCTSTFTFNILWSLTSQVVIQESSTARNKGASG
jgi:hypothetical protein